MTASTTARTRPTPLSIRLTETLIVFGLMLGAMLTSWPGLLKLAALLTVAFGYGGREAWRHRAETTVGALAAGPVAIVGTVAVAAVWPTALPGEQITTVVIVIAAAAVYSAAVAYALRHRSS